jgi:hypothetical protein
MEAMMAKRKAVVPKPGDIIPLRPSGISASLPRVDDGTSDYAPEVLDTFGKDNLKGELAQCDFQLAWYDKQFADPEMIAGHPQFALLTRMHQEEKHRHANVLDRARELGLV